MFEQLVGLIDGIKKDSIGEWIVDRENDGTPEHPEYGLNRYGSIIIRHPPCFGRAFFQLNCKSKFQCRSKFYCSFKSIVFFNFLKP